MSYKCEDILYVFQVQVNCLIHEIISRCVCESVSGPEQHLNRWPEKRKWPSPMQSASRNPVGAWTEQKGRRRVNLLSRWELETSVLSCPETLCWVSSFQTQTRSYTISSPGFHSNRITCRLSWFFSSVCSWQILGLLGLHNCVNEFLQ